MITLEVPPLLNRLYKIGKRGMYKNPEANRYKTSCFVACHQAKIYKPTDAELELSIKWYRKSLRGDIDGILKVLLDALQGILYENDSQIMKLTVEKLHDKKNPRIELEYFLYEN